MPVNKKKVNVNYVNSDLSVNGESLLTFFLELPNRRGSRTGSLTYTFPKEEEFKY